jgi:hypothetical protein
MQVNQAQIIIGQAMAWLLATCTGLNVGIKLNKNLNNALINGSMH